MFRFLVKKAQYFCINIADNATIHTQSHKLESHLPVCVHFVRLFTEMIEKLCVMCDHYAGGISNSTIERCIKTPWCETRGRSALPKLPRSWIMMNGGVSLSSNQIASLWSIVEVCHLSSNQRQSFDGERKTKNRSRLCNYNKHLSLWKSNINCVYIVNPHRKWNNTSIVLKVLSRFRQRIHI